VTPFNLSFQLYRPKNTLVIPLLDIPLKELEVFAGLPPGRIPNSQGRRMAGRYGQNSKLTDPSLVCFRADVRAHLKDLQRKAILRELGAGATVVSTCAAVAYRDTRFILRRKIQARSPFRLEPEIRTRTLLASAVEIKLVCLPHGKVSGSGHDPRLIACRGGL
jgi:hypothetical protein